MATSKRLPFNRGWSDRQKIREPATNKALWNVLPLWKRLLDPLMRSEIEHMLDLEGFGLKRRIPNHVRPYALHRRESHKQMKKLIDAIVDTGKVHVQDGAGRFNTIVSREGKNEVVATVLKASPELQACFLKWWALVVEDTPPLDLPDRNPGPYGVYKEAYVWLITRVLSFLLINTDQSQLPSIAIDGMLNGVDRLRSCAAQDWYYDSHQHHMVTYAAFCDMLYDLSSLWCDVGMSHNIPERVEFLMTMYNHVFFHRLPAWTPDLVLRRIEQCLAAKDAAVDQVVVVSEPPTSQFHRSNTYPPRDPEQEYQDRPLRRYEQILESIQYQEPPAFNGHNLYQSFPFRKLMYPSPVKKHTAADFAPRQPPDKYQPKLPSYSKTLKAVAPRRRVPPAIEESWTDKIAESTRDPRAPNTVRRPPRGNADSPPATPRSARQAQLHSPTKAKQVQLIVSSDLAPSTERVTVTVGVTTFAWLLEKLYAKERPSARLVCTLPNGSEQAISDQASLDALCEGALARTRTPVLNLRVIMDK